jgi:hypothetical protein
MYHTSAGCVIMLITTPTGIAVIFGGSARASIDVFGNGVHGRGDEPLVWLSSPLRRESRSMKHAHAGNAQRRVPHVRGN